MADEPDFIMNAPPPPMPNTEKEPIQEPERVQNTPRATLPHSYLKPIRMEIWNWDKLKKSIEGVAPPSAHLSIMPQEPRFRKRRHHFYLKHATDRQRLMEMLKGTYGERMSVQLDDPTGQHTTDYEKNDVHLMLDNRPAGEIQFLLCHTPDIGTPSKYYIHIYLQKFLDEELFAHVQSTLPLFFQSLSSHGVQRSMQRSAKRASRKTRGHSSRARVRKFETRRRPRYLMR